MFKYYLILFARNVLRQKLFSFINLAGLTAGIVSTLLIYLYVQHELSFDRFHDKANRIYRINQTFIWGENDDHQFSSTGPGVSYGLAAEIPEVEQVTRIHTPGKYLVTYTDPKEKIKSYDEEKIFAVDSNFFRIFTFPMIKGNPETALINPGSLVITESTAKRYFGEDEPLGKLLSVGTGEEKKTFEVTGIIKDVPVNSYIDFDFLMSMSSFERVKRQGWSWIWTMFETFVLLDEHASPDAIQNKLPMIPRKYAEATLQRVMNTSFDDYLKKGKQWNLYMQPLTDIHLHSGNVYNRLNNVGNIKVLYVLMGVEVLIILLSCINFMNLSTAQYTRRIKETAIRKILGSERYQLSLYFFSEAFMFCSLAIIMGLGITQLILPYFNILTAHTLSLNLIQNKMVPVVLLALLVIMSLLSGSYPAAFLSAFRPVEAMRGKLRTGREGKRIRNGMVIFQFTISMLLIACTLVVFQQLKYLSEKDIGFNRENLLVISRVEWVNDKETFVNALVETQGVASASWCTAAPPKIFEGDSFSPEGNSTKTVPLNYVNADERYLPTLDLHLNLGRNFLADAPADWKRVILNETAVKDFGWSVDESVIGKKVIYGDAPYEVVGVIKDFNYWALQSPIQPMAIFHVKGPMWFSHHEFVTLRIAAGDLEHWDKLIATLQQHWKRFAGDTPFQYEFVDQAFAATFQAEEQFGKALSIFASLAIVIASLGLLGMIIYTLEQRTKEIGIRKVAGASVWNILVLVSKDYTRLIGIALLLSTPLSIWILHRWLQDFEYRITPSPWAFIAAGCCTLLISILITSYHSVKAALTNPVEALKEE